MSIRRLALQAVLPLATAACTLQVAGTPARLGLPAAAPSSGVATSSPLPTQIPTPATEPSGLPSSGLSATPAPDWHRYAKPVSVFVRDEDGRPLEDATVRIRLLEHPSFDATIQGHTGAWEPVLVPQGVFEVVASRPGWTTRRRLGVIDDRIVPALEINFGFLTDGDLWSTAGVADYLSDYPEVESIAPAANTYVAGPSVPVVDTPRVAVVLTFSEPFDEATQRRLAAAVRLWPSDDDSGNADAIDLSRFANADEGDGLADHPLDFRPGAEPGPTRGAVHMGLDGHARTTWSADGRTLTFAVDGPMGEVGKALGYQVGLISDGAVYTDSTGHALGSNHAGRRDVAVPHGQLVANTFREGLAGTWTIEEARALTASQRWNATHVSTFNFQVRLGR